MRSHQGLKQTTIHLRSLLVAYCIGVCVLAVVGWRPLLSNYSVSNPLLPPNVRMTDLLDYRWKVDHLSGPVMGGPGPTYNYPAPAAFVYAFFLHRGSPAQVYYTAAVLAAVVALLLAFRFLRPLRSHRSLSIFAFTATVIFSSPFYFVLDRGNLEWVNWIFVVLAIAALVRRQYLLTAILIGLAVCMKPFPVLFFLLLLFRGRFKEVFAGVAVAAGTILIAVKALGPTLFASYKGLQVGFKTYFTGYVVSLHPRLESRFDHALMGVVRKLLYARFNPTDGVVSLTGPGVPLWARLDLWYYTFAVFAVLVIAFIAFRFRKRATVDSILAISVAAVVLPFLAAEYTLMLLYIPFTLVLVSLAEQRRDIDVWQALTLVLLGLVLLPLSAEFFGYVGVAKCMLLVLLFFCANKAKFPLRALDGPEPATS